MNDTWWVSESDLDDDQKDVVTLPLEGRFLVVGPPGSGKSNLLLLRANYLARANRPNLLVLVFTRTLEEFLVAGGGKYAFDRDKILTSTRWATSFLREHSIEVERSGGFEKVRLQILARASELIESSAIQKPYDTILLDEAQDYLPDEIRLFRRLSHNLFAVADSRQKIYGGADPRDVLATFCTVHPLRYHYRNGLHICRCADRVGQGMSNYEPLEQHSNYDENAYPSEVRLLASADIAGQCQKIVASLLVQLKAYPESFLGVLCPTRDDLDRVWSYLSTSPVGEKCVFQQGSQYLPFDSSRPVCVTTLHSAKGLEFRAVHLAAAESLKRFPSPRNLAYVALTRAKTSFTAHHSETVHGFFEAALLGDTPPKHIVSIAEAFGG